MLISGRVRFHSVFRLGTAKICDRHARWSNVYHRALDTKVRGGGKEKRVMQSIIRLLATGVRRVFLAGLHRAVLQSFRLCLSKLWRDPVDAIWVPGRSRSRGGAITCQKRGLDAPHATLLSSSTPPHPTRPVPRLDSTLQTTIASKETDHLSSSFLPSPSSLSLSLSLCL